MWEAALHRICQEALTNVARHAGADVTHVVYFPASRVGVQVSTDRFIEVY